MEQEFKIELDKIRNLCDKLEQKYSFWKECDFLNYLLDKICDIEEVEIKTEDYENHKTMYVMYKSKEKIILKRLKEGGENIGL